AQALGHADRPVRIGQANHAAAPLPEDANPARQENQTDRAGIGEQEIVTDILERGPLCRRSDARGTSPLGHPLRLLGQLQNNLPLLVKSERRKRGKNNRANEQERRDPREERPQTQPQIYPDTAVNPGNEQHRDLYHAEIEPYHPQIIQGLPIAFLQPPQLGSEPLAYDMRAKQRRNTETKDELDEFCRFPFEVPALVERPQSERSVDRESGIKQ